MSERPENPHPIYDLFRKTPPERETKTTQACAYWNGFDGVPIKYVRGSVTEWAYRAGRDERLLGKWFAEDKPHE